MARWRRSRRLARQAADVHEPQWPCRRRVAAILQGRARGLARDRRRSAARSRPVARAAGRHGRRAQRLEVAHRAARHRGVLAGCVSGSAAGMHAATWQITCWRRSIGTNGRAVEEMIGRAADAAELFAAEGIGPVMNRFNRKKKSRSRIAGEGEDGNRQSVFSLLPAPSLQLPAPSAFAGSWKPAAGS